MIYMNENQELVSCSWDPIDNLQASHAIAVLQHSTSKA